VNTHVTVALVSRLPVPVVRPGDPAFGRLLELARTMARGSRPVEETDEYAELQAIAARLYGLTSAEFEHVLRSFPLVPEETKERALSSLGKHR
jgi:hypothetical protein